MLVRIPLKGTLELCKVKLIKKANRKTKVLSVDSLNDKNVTFDVQKMKVDCEGEYYVWNEELMGAIFKVAAQDCYTIQPSLIELGGRLKYTFDKQMILDLNVGINVNENTTNTSSRSASASSSSSSTSKPSSKSSNLVDCYICKKKIDLVAMRRHVGYHILSKKLSGNNVCGFCGRDTCENLLKRSSTEGTSVYF